MPGEFPEHAETAQLLRRLSCVVTLQSSTGMTNDEKAIAMRALEARQRALIESPPTYQEKKALVIEALESEKNQIELDMVKNRILIDSIKLDLALMEKRLKVLEFAIHDMLS